MKIADTMYWLELTRFLRVPPEAVHTTFSDEGFAYINGELEIAIALCRTSKSNYDVTVIYAGEIYTVTEHSQSEAIQRICTAIQNVRKG